MTKMKLYYSPGSPYARKVRVVAMETRLDRKMEMVNVVVSPVVPNADVDKHNPIGKIPAFSVKGMNLFDSPVICEYLDSQHKGRKLLPRKGRERWVALRLQAMADGLLDAAIANRPEVHVAERGAGDTAVLVELAVHSHEWAKTSLPSS
jgi:glutathione S-transferase